MRFNAIGGLVGESDLEIAREVVRRARRCEQAEARLREIKQGSEKEVGLRMDGRFWGSSARP